MVWEHLGGKKDGTAPWHADSSAGTGVDQLTKRPLPKHWESRASRTTGEIYYYNNQTNTSQFEFPAEEVELPPGWEAAISRSTGEVYYVETATGKSQVCMPSLFLWHVCPL
eukprot:SAG31_NODE_849_length_11529_cov_3.342257_3_plen_111_part_00